MRRSALFSIIFIACIAISGWPSFSIASDLTTPEKAISAYIDAVAHGNFEAVMAATPAEKISAKFDFVAFASRIEALSPLSSMPTTNPFFIEINKAKFANQISQQVQLLIYGLMTTDDFVNSSVIRMDAARIADFAKTVRAERLTDLSIVKIGIPMPEVLNSERHKANMDLIAGNNGADEMTERVALLSFEGNHYAIGFSLLRYGNEWAVFSQTSRAAATNALGAPGRMTPNGFEGMLR